MNISPPPPPPSPSTDRVRLRSLSESTQNAALILGNLSSDRDSPSDLAFTLLNLRNSDSRNDPFNRAQFKTQPDSFSRVSNHLDHQLVVPTTSLPIARRIHRQPRLSNLERRQQQLTQVLREIYSQLVSNRSRSQVCMIRNIRHLARTEINRQVRHTNLLNSRRILRTLRLISRITKPQNLHNLRLSNQDCRSLLLFLITSRHPELNSGLSFQLSLNYQSPANQ